MIYFIDLMFAGWLRLKGTTRLSHCFLTMKLSTIEATEETKINKQKSQF